MRIAIAGAGMTGAYLYRRLTNAGVSCAVIDPHAATRCGLTPCAWGTSRGFEDLVRKAGLNPRNYILKRFDHIRMDGETISADLMTFDKPKLIADLIRGAHVLPFLEEPGRWDRLIDATGVARAWLQAPVDDLILECVQFRVMGAEGLRNRIRLGTIGYAWCFPLGEKEAHVGCGSLTGDPRARLAELGWMTENSEIHWGEVACACHGRIRIAGPGACLPFVSRGDPPVWGVGEAIGCVAPLAGDGIVPGMQSVDLLLANWEDAQAYTRAILTHFAWMADERRVVECLAAAKSLGPAHAWVLKRNSRRMGMDIGLAQALRLLMRLQ